MNTNIEVNKALHEAAADKAEMEKLRLYERLIEDADSIRLQNGGGFISRGDGGWRLSCPGHDDEYTYTTLLDAIEAREALKEQK